MRELGGELFAERGSVDNYFQILPGGVCHKHGPFPGAQCPQWPDCDTGVAPTEEQVRNEKVLGPYLVPVSDAEMLDLTNSFGLVRADSFGRGFSDEQLRMQREKDNINQAAFEMEQLCYKASLRERHKRVT